ncbi:hypothetical protein E2562_024891 [Oryza meyeriana var. granulata]|uniref:Uncharacterized protein n=1 Tax=Oryza meyeriana var. granulata TaxID=110450 RepID=A0A6G1DNY9_9ORYZ|nr:hypothetical protein E2562_024891 [Oryza meyeriana var. granulata]
MAAAGPGHGDEAVMEGNGGGKKNTGAANQEADASAKAVNHEGKQSKGRAAAATHVMLQEPTKHDDTVAAVSNMMSMDYKTQDARHHRPINNDAPLDHELVEKP